MPRLGRLGGGPLRTINWSDPGFGERCTIRGNPVLAIPIRRNTMKWFVRTLLGAVLALGASQAWAQTAAISLSIPPTARANGMGEAYAALAEDATGAWWNPAAIGFLTKRDASMTHAQLVPDLAEDVFHDYFSMAFPVKNVGTFAGSFLYLSYGQSDARGPSGEDFGTFRSYEFSPSVSYGVALEHQIAIGATFKYVRVQLAPDLPFLPPGAGTGSTVALDAGVLWKIPAVNNMFNVAMTLQNLGPDITFIEGDGSPGSDPVSDPIYRNLKVGGAAHLYNKNSLGAIVVLDYNQLLVKGEIRDTSGAVRRRYGKPIWNGGAELGYKANEVSVALRGGYVNDSDGSISVPTYGLGLGYKILRVDFASLPQAEDNNTGTKLDRVKKFSLSARF